MQRLFTMFPAGWPGLALLLLRVAVAATAIVNVCAPEPSRPAWLLLILWVMSFALGFGVFTPIAALLLVAVQIVRFAINVDHPTWRLVGILIALALVFLGPGAYSMDARRFGRRRVTFPPHKDGEF